MKSESIKKIVSMLLVLAVAASIAFTDVASIEVQAATKKVSTSATDAKLKKIPSVKKGTTLVTMKKMHTYVKFKATKTKTYTFTISNIYDPVNKKGAVNGYFTIRKPYSATSSYLDRMDVKTKGGKADSLQIANKYFLTNWSNSGKTVDKYFTSRYAKVKLTKGQTVYIEGFCAGVKKGKVSYTLKIK